MNIGELADKLGLSRRTIRFYVHRGLIPPPEGRGRGSEYGPRHLERLRRIHELKDAGHSLAAIARILMGKIAEASAGGVAPDTDQFRQGHARADRSPPVRSAADDSAPAETFAESGRASSPAGGAPPRGRIAAGLWTRIRLADGVELHLDASKHNPRVERLLELKQVIHAFLGSSPEAPSRPGPTKD